MSYNTREKPVWNCANEYISKKIKDIIKIDSIK